MLAGSTNEKHRLIVATSLVLHGDGSAVYNLEIDGSITPNTEDVGLIRFDFDSDNEIDHYVVTLEPKKGKYRWPIAAGIYANFQQAPDYSVVDISDNRIRYVNGNAIRIEHYRSAMVSGNDISGGRASTFLQSGSGTYGFDGINLTFRDNSVTGYREGFSSLATSGTTVLNNDLVGNTNAMTFDRISEAYGPNLVAENLAAQSTATGIVLRDVNGISVQNNRVRSNGVNGDGTSDLYGIDAQRSAYVRIASNDIRDNGTDSKSDGGVRISQIPIDAMNPEQQNHNSVTANNIMNNSGVGVVIDNATHNTVAENNVKFNGGVGIVLFGGATNNAIEFNRSMSNGRGIIAVPTAPDEIPILNTINDNIFRQNSEYDVADFEPICFYNTWLSNTTKPWTRNPVFVSPSL